MKKTQQNRGIIPRKVKGFRDIDAGLNKLRWTVIEAATEVYRLYGFEHLDTPILEYADCLGKYLPDKETVDEGVYSFKNPEIEPVYDKLGKELRDDWDRVVMENHFVSLRYDLTAPLARVYSERLWNAYLQGNVSEGKTELFRRFQYGPVYRYEKKIEFGRYREFWQLDFDSVGTKDVVADAEVSMVLADAMEMVGLKRGSYVVNVNNRKILKGFLRSIGIKDEKTEQDVLRILDKVDKIGLDGMIQEIGDGRTDEKSEAKIPGLKLNKVAEIDYNNLVDSLVLFYEKFNVVSTRKEALSNFNSLNIDDDIFKEGVEELSQIDEVLTTLKFNEDRIVFSPTLVRGMAYYTGPIFEVESLQYYKDNKGAKRKFGIICGGGRYDGLVKNLLGIAVPATGASIGVDRLCELLTLTGVVSQEVIGPVLIINFDDKLMTEYQKIASELRIAGIHAEIYYGDQRGLKKQLAYADKRNCPVAVFLGENELKRGVVTIKDLMLGKQMKDIRDREEWKSKVQQEVELKDLKETIKSMLL